MRGLGHGGGVEVAQAGRVAEGDDGGDVHAVEGGDEGEGGSFLGGVGHF